FVDRVRARNIGRKAAPFKVAQFGSQRRQLLVSLFTGPLLFEVLDLSTQSADLLMPGLQFRLRFRFGNQRHEFLPGETFRVKFLAPRPRKFRALENAVKSVVIARSHGIVLVIVTTGASKVQPEKRLPDRFDRVLQRQMPKLVRTGGITSR